jgi:hypothetical protein
MAFVLNRNKCIYISKALIIGTNGQHFDCNPIVNNWTQINAINSIFTKL